MNNYINWIESRRSVSQLTDPAPTKEQVKEAIHCAMTAPDHRKLKPWRFIVTQGDDRHTLAKVFLQSAQLQAKQKGKQLSDKKREKTLTMPLRSPMVITVLTNMQTHEKVPDFEQLLSAGACVQNLLLALQAQGFATIWRSGSMATNMVVREYFKLSERDCIAGFIYVGTAVNKVKPRSEFNIDDYVKFE